MAGKYRVGIIGLQAGRWAANAHIPALKALSDQFEIAGVANSSTASSRAAADAFGISRAFDSVDDLVASPDVDIVTIAVKVPHHHDLATRALRAGKHVFCEWPLGNGIDQARAMTALAHEQGVRAFAGTQALFAPEVIHLRELLARNHVGDLLATNIVASAGLWGPAADNGSVFALDRSNGATILTIPLGHTLTALTHAMGPIAELSATLGFRRKTALNVDTGQAVPITAPDVAMIDGTLASGVPFSIAFRGGAPRGPGLVWDIHGFDGDLRISGSIGLPEMVPLELSGANGQGDLQPIPLPEPYASDMADGPVAGNVRRVYSAIASDLRKGTALAPTFDYAVTMHQIIEAIERSATTGRRLRPGDM